VQYLKTRHFALLGFRHSSRGEEVDCGAENEGCSDVLFFVAADLFGKDKSKVHPRTGHEVPEGEKRYSSTLSFT
jgi:hypothetical protein